MLELVQCCWCKCLVQIKKGRTPIRLLNPSTKDIYIPGHWAVALVSDVNIKNVHKLDKLTTDNLNANANVSSASPNRVKPNICNFKNSELK